MKLVQDLPWNVLTCILSFSSLLLFILTSKLSVVGMQHRFFPAAEGLYKAFVAALSTLMTSLSLLATGKNQGFWVLTFGNVSVVNLIVKSCPKLQMYILFDKDQFEV